MFFPLIFFIGGVLGGSRSCFSCIVENLASYLPLCPGSSVFYFHKEHKLMVGERRNRTDLEKKKDV